MDKFNQYVISLCNSSDIAPFEESSINCHIIEYILNNKIVDNTLLTEKDYLYFDSFDYVVHNRENQKDTGMVLIDLLVTHKEKEEYYMCKIILDTYSAPLFLSTYDTNENISQDIFCVEPYQKKVFIYEKVK